MAHKVLIGGTAYAVAKGRTLVNGTGRDIKKGRTLVNGTGCDITFGGALKWVLNAVIALPLKELRDRVHSGRNGRMARHCARGERRRIRHSWIHFKQRRHGKSGAGVSCAEQNVDHGRLPHDHLRRAARGRTACVAGSKRNAAGIRAEERSVTWDAAFDPQRITGGMHGYRLHEGDED